MHKTMYNFQQDSFSCHCRHTCHFKYNGWSAKLYTCSILNPICTCQKGFSVLGLYVQVICIHPGLLHIVAKWPRSTHDGYICPAWKCVRWQGMVNLLVAGYSKTAGILLDNTCWFHCWIPKPWLRRCITSHTKEHIAVEGTLGMWRMSFWWLHKFLGVLTFPLNEAVLLLLSAPCCTTLQYFITNILVTSLMSVPFPRAAHHCSFFTMKLRHLSSPFVYFREIGEPYAWQCMLQSHVLSEIRDWLPRK